MRKLYTIVVVATLTLTGCTATRKDNATPAPSASRPADAKPTPSVSPSAVPDLLIRDVSVARPLVVTRDLLHATYGVRIAYPGGAPVICTVDSQEMAVVGDQTREPFYCSENYVAVPAGIQTWWKTYPAIGIWYLMARAAVISKVVYAKDPNRAACAAAYVAAQKLGYKRDVDGEQLLSFINQLYNGIESAFAKNGLHAAANGKPISACAQ